MHHGCRASQIATSAAAPRTGARKCRRFRDDERACWLTACVRAGTMTCRRPAAILPVQGFRRAALPCNGAFRVLLGPSRHRPTPFCQLRSPVPRRPKDPAMRPVVPQGLVAQRQNRAASPQSPKNLPNDRSTTILPQTTSPARLTSGDATSAKASSTMSRPPRARSLSARAINALFGGYAHPGCWD